MSRLAPTLQAWFTERLSHQLEASPHTVASYRDTIKLLVRFASERSGRAPSDLEFSDLDATVVADFLEHLEHVRHNSIATRNVRLTAVRSFFHFAAFEEPTHAALIARVLAIPEKRTQRRVVSFLTKTEMEALIDAPDPETWIGRRDRTLLLVACQSGLRVSELIGLRGGDVVSGAGPHLRVRGKGRKDRCTPLTRHTMAALRSWMAERAGEPDDALFPTIRGTAMTRDNVAHLVTKHAERAADRCPSLQKKRVTPHTLRHSCAMGLLTAGVDTSTIALWLGHEHVQSTQIYLHGDLTIKERALARTAPPETKPGRYRPSDTLLAFLDGL